MQQGSHAAGQRPSLGEYQDNSLGPRPEINEAMVDIESDISQVAEKSSGGILGNRLCFVASQNDRTGAGACTDDL